MQSLRATATAATEVQNSSVNELHMVQGKNRKKGLATEVRSQGTCKPFYHCRATPSHPKKKCPARDVECCKCRKKGHFKGSCKLKNKVARAKDMKRK